MKATQILHDMGQSNGSTMSPETSCRDPEALKEILGNTLGIEGVVRKLRTLYFIGQTRVPIDEVAGLGTFLELEVVLRDGQADARKKTIAERLMSEFGIDKQGLIPEAYIDLIR